jgi:hypothetical protein
MGALNAGPRMQTARAGYTPALNAGEQCSDPRGKAEAESSVKYPDPYYFIPWLAFSERECCRSRC